MTRGTGVRRLGVLAGAGTLVVAASMLMTRAQAAPAATQSDPAAVAAGRRLFLTGCSSCHGLRAEGTRRGPDLRRAGAASADFYLSTGRMPMADPDDQPQRKRPAYPRREIDALVAYIASLGPGPPVPVLPRRADLGTGATLYTQNCAACHSSTGAGGALGISINAPPLWRASDLEVAEAVRIGPGAMPVFGPETVSDEELAAIVRYVSYLKHPDDRGGIALGHVGPVSEGFVAWIIGLGAMLVACYWIGTRD
jgi:ubiquinol-cytochrome c reductase cytochrome c subunit